MARGTNGKRSLGGTLLVLALLAAAWFARSQGWLPETQETGAGGGVATADERAAAPAESAGTGADEIARAARSERSGFVVTVAATVAKTLPDDEDGSRHQRFIARLSNDLTVLVAHNIDLAPRVPLQAGDAVEIRGQYEWNAQGGVLHWTHHDPAKRREGGSIRRAGELYE